MKHFPKLLICLLVTVFLTSCASNASLIVKGDAAYESGDYKTALSEYKKIKENKKHAPKQPYTPYMRWNYKKCGGTVVFFSCQH